MRALRRALTTALGLTAAGCAALSGLSTYHEDDCAFGCDGGDAGGGESSADGLPIDAVAAADCRTAPQDCLTMARTCSADCSATEQQCANNCKNTQCRNGCKTSQTMCDKGCGETCATCAGGGSCGQAACAATVDP